MDLSKLTNELVFKIQAGEMDNFLTKIKESIIRRQTKLKKDSLIPGAKIRIHGVKPGYVNGSMGEIVWATDKKVSVNLDVPAYGPKNKDGERKCYHKGVELSIDCVSPLGKQVNFRKIDAKVPNETREQTAEVRPGQ